MRSFAPVAFAALAAAAPQAPSTAAGSGCSSTYSGSFQIELLNATTAHSKRSIANGEGPGHMLAITLQNGILLDAENRIGYIAANSQFQFDRPVQTGTQYASGWAVCGNNTLVLGPYAEFQACPSGPYYNIYLENSAAQCGPVYIQAISTGASAGATQVADGQPQASGAATQIGDGQVQASGAATQIGDGQVQAPTGVATQIGDGQVQAPTAAASQIGDGQVQAPTAAASQIGDGQVQAPTAAASQIGDGQVQAPTAAASQIGDGQVQAPGAAATQIGDGQVQAPVTNGTVSSAKPSAYTGAASSQSVFGLGAIVIGFFSFVAQL